MPYILHIRDLDLSMDFGCKFSEKISMLKKMRSLRIESTIYASVPGFEDLVKNPFHDQSIKKLNVVRELVDVPSVIWVGKTNYFWVFSGCKFVYKDIRKHERDYFGIFSSIGQEPKQRWLVEIEISYEGVFGTNRMDVVKREIALSNLLND